MITRQSVFTFAKAQVSAFVGGICDYLIMIFLTEMFGIHYTMSIMFSGIAGALINFSINRRWAFTSQGSIHSPLGNQLVKFVFVVAGSIVLKSAGTYLVTSLLNLDYRVSRLMVDLMVSYGFNYTLLRYWVFRPRVSGE